MLLKQSISLADQSTIVVATNNPGKLKEFALLLPNYKIISQSSLGITPEEELGETFFENSLQKARVANAASGKLSLGDDSGLIVPALNNLPGLRSARYAHECATDEENRLFLKQELEKLEVIHGEKFWERVDQLTYDHYGLADAMFNPNSKNSYHVNGGKHSTNIKSNFEYFVLERG